MKINVIELFGGIGACTKALKNLGVKVNIIDYVEIDKYACKSYNAINNTNFEPQDIMKWDKHFENIDLITHGSPCQDFSLAGKQQGGDEGSGTRSSLMYETLRIVADIKPRYVLWENVKNLLSKKHKHNFDNYLNYMNDLGYTNYYQVLNAKDYGIPQNRERVFTISIRNDIDKKFVFPPKEELKLKLKDMLEDEVDEKYYLSGKQIERITTTNYNAGKTRIQEKECCDTLLARDWKDPKCVEVNRKYGVFDTDKTTHQAGSVYDENGLCPTLDTMQGGWRQSCVEIKNATKKGYLEDGFVERKYNNFIKEKGYVPEMFNPYNESEIEEIAPTQSTYCGSMTSSATVLIKNATKRGYLEAEEGDGVNISSRMKYQRGNVQKEMSQTLDTQATKGVVVKTIGNYMPSNHNASRIVDSKGLAPTVMENHGTVTAILEPNHNSQRLFDGLRIRKLTPKECWRLMGFDDSDFEKAEKENSNTQLYKQAGNSIVVKVLEKIFQNLL